MSETINVHDVKTHFSRLFERAHTGQKFIPTKACKPYARLVPLEAKSTSRQSSRLTGIWVPYQLCGASPAIETDRGRGRAR